MEVQRQVEGGRDVDKPVEEAGQQSGDVGGGGEDAQGHDGVAGDFPLDEEEAWDREGAEDEEVEHDGGGPCVGDTAEVETEEEEEDGGYEEEGAEPVNGEKTLTEGGGGRVEVESQDDHGEDGAGDGD